MASCHGLPVNWNTSQGVFVFPVSPLIAVGYRYEKNSGFKSVPLDTSAVGRGVSSARLEFFFGYVLYFQVFAELFFHALQMGLPVVFGDVEGDGLVIEVQPGELFCQVDFAVPDVFASEELFEGYGFFMEHEGHEFYDLTLRA